MKECRGPPVNDSALSSPLPVCLTIALAASLLTLMEDMYDESIDRVSLLRGRFSIELSRSIGPKNMPEVSVASLVMLLPDKK